MRSLRAFKAGHSIRWLTCLLVSLVALASWYTGRSGWTPVRAAQAGNAVQRPAAPQGRQDRQTAPDDRPWKTRFLEVLAKTLHDLTDVDSDERDATLRMLRDADEPLSHHLGGHAKEALLKANRRLPEVVIEPGPILPPAPADPNAQPDPPVEPQPAPPAMP